MEKYTELIAHVVRVSSELGADIIKTNYTGTVESFKRVITAANEKPVVIAGGAKLPIADSLKMVEDAMSAGASGISYGRNVFNADNIELYLSAVTDIIFHEKKYQDCLNQFVERI